MKLEIRNEILQFGLSKEGATDFLLTIHIESIKTREEYMEVRIILDEGEFKQLKELIEVF